MDEQTIQEVATAEILHPTLAITQQFLETNPILFEKQKPVIAGIIFHEKEQTAEVYFPVEGERYYFVIELDLAPRTVPRWARMSAGNRVYFYAKSATHRADELVALAGIEPTRTWQKEKHIKHHGFEVEPCSTETGEVEDKLQTLINVLLPYAANIRALSALAHVGINVAYWGYKEQMWGIYFGTDTVQGLATLKLSVDVDLYASGPDLGES